jgi:septal ring factor EnvC (AmiA/AmiB activator)
LKPLQPEKLERDVERLSRENERLRQELIERDRKLTEAEKHIADLERKLALRLQNSVTSSKPPSSDGLASSVQGQEKR